MLQFEAANPQLPAVIADELSKHYVTFSERCADYIPWFKTALADKLFAEQLQKAWGCSTYLFESCLRAPAEFQRMIDSSDHLKIDSEGAMSERLSSQLAHVENKSELDSALRQFRRAEMMRIIWRDLNRLADMAETTLDVSRLAECAVAQALDFHHRDMAQSVGRPVAEVDGELEEQRMIVLGMGKLGARELNLSSDIDLIFCYPQGGRTVDGEKSLDNHEFFTRLGQRLIQSIDTMTVDGFVFRVDMRLRPYGDSGALVLSFDAMEEYYQDQGRDWERYAMIKARVIAGDQTRGEQLTAMLRPFSFRRYIDFSAIDSLRDMKQMIQREVKRRRLDNNVKLGPGGIREVEFIAQSFQLIRGGRELALQQRSLLKILLCLEDNQCLPPQAVSELTQAYHFLRNAEHAIQAWQDRQTQTLPEYDYPQTVLAFAMGFDSWADFETALSEHRAKVSEHFAAVIADAQDDDDEDTIDNCWQQIWLGDSDEAESVQSLVEAGHEDAAVIYAQLERLRNSNVVTRMQAIGRGRLDTFMPMLLQAVSEAEQPSQTLGRILPLVESVLRRTAYLVLLVENPSALRELVALCALSPWISSQLARHPVLLDELLNASSLYSTPDKAELQDDLTQQVLRLPMDDLEAHMETLRYFRLAHVLKVAACEVSGRLPLMKVSDYLTWIAEVILEHVLAVAWHALEEKHGRPMRKDGSACDKDFIIVGYGKLGGIELGHGSDLDLVFIHSGPSNIATNGPRPIDNSMFFTRLGQRMIHILTAQTSLGALYEVDMRLRPSGASGLLVSSLEAFKLYQAESAWTWEHQALVRARVVAGDPELAKQFDEVRCQQLSQNRDEAKLKADVVQMRQKMRDHQLPKGGEAGEKGLFAIKQGIGGIVDIEFMVQYAVLAWSQKHPALAAYTDNIRILEALQHEGLFSSDEATALMEAYKVYRAHAHKLSLQQQKVALPANQLAPYRAAVQAKWDELLG